MSDTELEKLKSRKLREMERLARKPVIEPSKTATEQKKDPGSIVRKKLVGRGEEVLRAAWSQYPTQTEALVRQLAKLIESGQFTGQLTGEKLYSVLRYLGLQVSLRTRIVVAEHGKVKSLAEKMKGS